MVTNPATARPREAARRCVRCGAPFHCGRDDPGGCWCANLPPLPREAYAAEAACLCPVCLRAALDAQRIAVGNGS